MNKEQPKTTHTFGDGLFAINICDTCKHYEVTNKPNLIFHAIRAGDLTKHSEGKITPQGDPNAPYYLKYLGRRRLHLGPLAITGLFGNEPDNLWFGFDIKKLRAKYPDPIFMNHHVWEELGFHAEVFTVEEERQMRERLFVSGYNPDVPTEILLNSLDVNLADYLVLRNFADITSAREFAGKDLGTVLLEHTITKKIWDDHIANLNVTCPVHS